VGAVNGVAARREAAGRNARLPWPRTPASLRQSNACAAGWLQDVRRVMRRELRRELCHEPGGQIRASWVQCAGRDSRGRWYEVSAG
jgi:hypothetical protein